MAKYPIDGVPGILVDILYARSTGVPKRIIDERARAHGLSRDQLYRAKRKLGVVAVKQKGTMRGGWYWILPEYATTQHVRGP
jgi:hypothetical protein